ncbi:hypothetical protein PVAP13_3KG122756 [Panicum virgatum]|uniref:Uncharacterized protein n=1 Tax=Panicum virgatum TaxID=38727 RepID=A0A8T0V1H3_PANVG|nr:hypothetical protein PVAP13_3KG122756 [Panicum virgatum]
MRISIRSDVERVRSLISSPSGRPAPYFKPRILRCRSLVKVVTARRSQVPSTCEKRRRPAPRRRDARAPARVRPPPSRHRTRRPNRRPSPVAIRRSIHPRLLLPARAR